MSKSTVVLIFSVVVVALAGSAAFAAEVESPAKAAMRKKPEEKKKAEAGGATSVNSGLIDLNKATRPQLMTLPGIGEAEADKIIAGRPYQTKTQLRERKIVSATTFYGIIDKVVIVPEKKAAPRKSAPAPAPQQGKDETKPKRNVFRELMKEKGSH